LKEYVESSHPQIEAVMDDNNFVNQKHYKDFFHMRATGIFSASFILPETNFNLFNDYYQYALTYLFYDLEEKFIQCPENCPEIIHC